MFLKKKVRDLTIPLERYAAVEPESTLKDAVLGLRASYCQMETGMCTEAGPRTMLVVENGELLGILDFRSILAVLIPEVAGGLTERLEALGVSIAFAEVSASSMDESRAKFHARVIRNANVKVKDVMLKVRGTIQADAELLDALKLIFRNKITKIPVYEGKTLVGIVRETDLFLAVADILSIPPA
jgi:CBS domain-containing protein